MLKVYRKQFGDVVVLCLQGGIVTGEITALRDAVLSQKIMRAGHRNERSTELFPVMWQRSPGRPQ